MQVARGFTAVGILLALLAAQAAAQRIDTAIGVTRRGTPIRAVISGEALDFSTPKVRVLVVGGLDGSDRSTQLVERWVSEWYASGEAAKWPNVVLSAVADANPDGPGSGSDGLNGSGGDPTRGYPPQGEAYHSKTDPEAAYLWRWIGMHAPDLVVEVTPIEVDNPSSIWWLVPPSDRNSPVARLAAQLNKVKHLSPETPGLVEQLGQHAPSGTGSISALRLQSNNPAMLEVLCKAIDASGFRGPSPARAELQRRRARSALEVVRQLEPHYGHALPKVEYIPAVAIIARMRLGELTSDPSFLADAEKIVASYATGQQSATGDNPNASVYSGHLIFGELAKATGNPRYTELVRAIADRGFDAEGQPLASMPAHSEMSDSVFMHCPILAYAGRLTGEQKYYDMCLRHLRFMLKLNLRADGLHRHSPLDETAWGRGNGFPALGLALVLSELPEDHPIREEVLTEFRNHLRALLKHQDPTGAWHQIVDDPASYRELTSTCMITFAMARGVQRGWLDAAEFTPAIERGWNAVKTRVAADGTLVDVCTGTGKQNTNRDYYDRTAILGRDPRGGAMAMLVAAEIALWQRHSNQYE